MWPIWDLEYLATCAVPESLLKLRVSEAFKGSCEWRLGTLKLVNLLVPVCRLAYII